MFTIFCYWKATLGVRLFGLGKLAGLSSFTGLEELIFSPCAYDDLPPDSNFTALEEVANAVVVDIAVLFGEENRGS